MFLPESKPDDLDDYRLLIFDGHKTHIDLSVLLDLIEVHKVIPVVLPAHTSYFTQPLDVACFSPLKTKYKDVISNLCSYQNSAEIKKVQFSNLYHQARIQALTEANIRSGFRATSIWPQNIDALLRSRFIRRTVRAITPLQLIRQASSVHTPSNASDLRALVLAARQHKNVHRKMNIVLRKTYKTIDRLQARVALQKEQILAHTRWEEERSRAKAVQVSVDINSLFKDPEAVRTAIRQEVVVAAVAIQKKQATAVKRAAKALKDATQLLAIYIVIIRHSLPLMAQH